MIHKKDITGIILAGGKSTRMGSDKGFLSLNGMSFISGIVEAVKPLVSTILLVGDNSDYDAFKLRRVEDIIKDAGPIAGLYSGLFHSETKYNMVLSCDIPLIKTSVLKLLIKEIDEQTDMVQLKSQNKTMPLVALYRKRCMYTCKQLLLKDEKRLRKVADNLNTKTITVAPEFEQYLQNINTKAQLTALKHETSITKC